MTAHAMSRDKERCLEAGMDAYVSKPLRPNELLATVDGVLKSSQADANAEALSDVSGDGRSEREDGSRTGDANLESASEGASASLNQAALLAGFGGNRKVLREVIDMFLVDGPEHLTMLRRALEAADAQALSSSAHALKGSVGLFIQAGAFETARQLERTGKAGDLQSAASLLASLETDMRALDTTLRALREQLG
jgi:CheY-like chemotaxis protein